MKKVLVIGGTGNIGRSLTEELVRQGYETVAMARKACDDPILGAEILLCDRKNTEEFQKLSQKNFDIVYDLAAFSVDDLEADFRAFRECEQIIVASSAAVYGISSIQDMPVREDAPLKPARAYGVSKLQIEKKAMEYYYRFDWPVTIVRPSSCYGAQNAIFREIGIENSWIDRIRKGKPIAVGNGQIVRNLLHVRDVAYALALLLRHQDHTIGNAYNIVGADTLSWEQWHRAVMDVLGRQVETVEIPIETLAAFQCPTLEQYQMSWQYHGFYCGEKLHRHLPEFVERVPLAEGIAEQIALLDRKGLIPNSDEIMWEDAAIRSQLCTRGGANR